MKNVKVLFITLAILFIPLTFSQKALAQGPTVDSTDPSYLSYGSSGTIAIYGSNMSTPGEVQWSSDFYGYDDGVFFTVLYVSPDGTEIDLSYTTGYGYDGGGDLGSIYMPMDYNGSETEVYTPDITVGP
jgi:hypothetical protein